MKGTTADANSGCGSPDIWRAPTTGHRARMWRRKYHPRSDTDPGGQAAPTDDDSTMVRFRRSWRTQSPGSVEPSAMPWPRAEHVDQTGYEQLTVDGGSRIGDDEPVAERGGGPVGGHERSNANPVDQRTSRTYPPARPSHRRVRRTVSAPAEALPFETVQHGSTATRATEHTATTPSRAGSPRTKTHRTALPTAGGQEVTGFEPAFSTQAQASSWKIRGTRPHDPKYQRGRQAPNARFGQASV